MQLGVAADVQLVNDGPLPRNTRRPVVAPGEGRIDDTAPRHEGRAVATIEAEVVAAFELVAEQRRMPLQLANNGFGIRIEQELVRIEAMASLRDRKVHARGNRRSCQGEHPADSHARPHR